MSFGIAFFHPITGQRIRLSKPTGPQLQRSLIRLLLPTLRVVPIPLHIGGNSSPHSGYTASSGCRRVTSDDPSAYELPHAAVVNVSEAVPSSSSSPSEQQQQPQLRTLIRCDGHRIDEESWSTALTRPDKLLHVYECFWDLPNPPCGIWIEGDQSSVADHLALFHGFRGGEVTTRCLWRDCPKPHMMGTSIARHVVTHIGFRVKCNTCKHEFARVDACIRAHSRARYRDLQRELDARKVDLL